MVTLVSKGRELNVPKFRGLSKDDKPMNVSNGAEFLEIDTGDTYLFDESVPEWVKCNYCGGGGGGGSGYTVTTTETVFVPQQNVTVDQSWVALTGDLVMPNPGDVVTVTFGDTDYQVTAVEDAGWIWVGELDTSGEIPNPIFTTYPFCINFYEPYDNPGTLGAALNTDPEGTLSGTIAVKAAKVVKTVTVSDDFKEAAQIAVSAKVEQYEDDGDYYLDKSYNELYELFTAGNVPYYMHAGTEDEASFVYRYVLQGLIATPDESYIATFTTTGNTSEYIATDPDDPMQLD